ncbi:MAG: hypothetical protein L6Q81_06150 [Bacteroidia bacterium]|nr:hypothetical protein [Bacteroidia bacterium]
MIIKSANSSKTGLSYLDLLGSDEVALAKAFSYLISSDKDCYFGLLKFLGIRQKNSAKNFYLAEISTEKKRAEGRTDIEIYYKGQFHVIIECKIRKGKVQKQRTQYLNCFNKDSKVNVLCFITQERDTNKQVRNNIVIKNTSWFEVIELYNKKKYINKPIANTFMKFATKNYKMNQLKEILIQDLKEKTEIERFEKYGIYRRDETFGSPIYFAPYYTRSASVKEGITYLSKILGILTLKQGDIDDFTTDLESFANDATQVNNWIQGVKHGNDKKSTVYTYYFLDAPYSFKSPLRKDGGIKKGRGKNWIAAKIPPNRCVSFIDFVKHIPELVK